MGAEVLNFMTSYVVEHCCNCGIPFAMEASFMNKCRNNGWSFYCPAGHGQHYSKSEIGKLQDQLEAKTKLLEIEKQSKEWFRQRLDTETKRTSAFKGVVTRIKNRVGNGVCPCCNRTFQNLMRHMRHQHPGFKSEV